MNVIEALASASKGKRVRRMAWHKESPSIYRGDDGELKLQSKFGAVPLKALKLDSVLANDWVEL